MHRRESINHFCSPPFYCSLERKAIAGNTAETPHEEIESKAKEHTSKEKLKYQYFTASSDSDTNETASVHNSSIPDLSDSPCARIPPNLLTKPTETAI